MVAEGERVRVNGAEYRVLRLLGHGKGGYSYLVTDGRRESVLKQIHHEPCAYYSFGDKLAAELRDYARLRQAKLAMPELLDVDHGRERLLKEYIPGETVYALVLDDRLDAAARREIGEISARLRRAGLNIDYFPTNFIVCAGRLVYVDYECNEFHEEWSFESWGAKYWSRTPELLAYAASHAP